MKFQGFLRKLKNKEELEALSDQALDNYNQWFMAEHAKVRDRVIEIITQINSLEETYHEMPSFFGELNLYFKAQSGFDAGKGHKGGSTHYHVYSSKIQEIGSNQYKPGAIRIDDVLFSTQDSIYHYGEWLYTLSMCLKEAEAAYSALKKEEDEENRKKNRRKIIERICAA